MTEYANIALRICILFETERLFMYDLRGLRHNKKKTDQEKTSKIHIHRYNHIGHT